MQAQTPEVSAEKATTPAEQVLRPANGKARRYLVKRCELHQLGSLEESSDCIGCVPIDDHNHLLNELFAEQRRNRALLANLRNSFPLLDDNGLDEAEHHCEWHIQQERKRLHAILDPQTAAQPQTFADSKPCDACIDGMVMIDPSDGGTFITCKKCNGFAVVAVCPTCRGDVPAARAHLLAGHGGDA